MTGLGQWTECIRKAKESLPETTDFLTLSLGMFHSGQLSSAECAQRTNKAHEIKDFMGMDNLCEVPVRIDLWGKKVPFSGCLRRGRSRSYTCS